MDGVSIRLVNGYNIADAILLGIGSSLVMSTCNPFRNSKADLKSVVSRRCYPKIDKL